DDSFDPGRLFEALQFIQDVAGVVDGPFDLQHADALAGEHGKDFGISPGQVGKKEHTDEDEQNKNAQNSQPFQQGMSCSHGQIHPSEIYGLPPLPLRLVCPSSSRSRRSSSLSNDSKEKRPPSFSLLR